MGGLLEFVRRHFTRKGRIVGGDALTALAVEGFTRTVDLLTEANGQYVEAVEDLDQEIIDLQAAIEWAKDDRLAAMAAIAQNNGRIDKLHALLG